MIKVEEIKDNHMVLQIAQVEQEEED